MPFGQKMAIKFIINRHRPSVAATANALSAVFASHNSGEQIAPQAVCSGATKFR